MADSTRHLLVSECVSGVSPDTSAGTVGRDLGRHLRATVTNSFAAPILLEGAGRLELRNTRTARRIATRIEGAFRPADRRRGLLGRDHLDPGAALILAPCGSIHMFFMRFPIDVLFVRRDGRVTHAYATVRPWRLRIGWGAFAAVELPAGAIARSETRAGDTLEITRSA